MCRDEGEGAELLRVSCFGVEIQIVIIARFQQFICSGRCFRRPRLHLLIIYNSESTGRFTLLRGGFGKTALRLVSWSFNGQASH